MSKSERLTKVFDRSIEAFNRVQTACYEQRQESLQDRRFYSIGGGQYESLNLEALGDRARIEINKVHQAVMRVISEYRNNRFQVQFVSKKDKKTKLTKKLEDIFRNDEAISCAEEAYDNAVEEGVGGGFGALRLTTEYENEHDDDDDRQKIVIQPIYDADKCVFFDLNAKRADKSDAKQCWVLSQFSKQEFEKEWGVDVSSIQNQIGQEFFDWVTVDHVFIAEYYEIEHKKHNVYTYQTIAGIEERYTDEDFEREENLKDNLAALGSVLISTKRLKRKRVHKYIMCGDCILEDCGYVPGSRIPVVPYYGKRWFVDGIERFMGVVRLAKDCQRVLNMIYSLIADMAGNSRLPIPIFFAEQMAGHEQQWSQIHNSQVNYALINPIKDAMGNNVPSGPVGIYDSGQLPDATLKALQICDAAIKELLGQNMDAEKMVSNISTESVSMIQSKLDMNSYIYVSNAAKMKKSVAEVWLGMAKEIYVEENRKTRALSEEGEASFINLQMPVPSEEGLKLEDNIREADFDVFVNIGPQTATQRQALINKLTALMAVTQDPAVLGVLNSAIMMNIEGSGFEEYRPFFKRKLVEMGVIEPDEEEAKRLMMQEQNKEPTPEEQWYLSAAAKDKSIAMLNIAKTKESEASAKETVAKTLEILQTLDDTQKASVLRDMLLSVQQSQTQLPGAV